MALNWAVPEEMVGSRMTAARVTCGAICLSSSSHLPLKPYSKTMKPVMLPPGRERLSTKPAPTGSGTSANTIGKVRVTWYNTITLMVFSAKTTSGASATNSCAYLRARSATFSCQRMSIRTLRPSLQPNCCKACWNAATRAWPYGSSAARFMSTPMRSGCCARAASGHVTAAPPSVVIKVRRVVTRSPRRRGRAASAPPSRPIAQRSALQLALEFVEEPPIGRIGDDLVGGRLDHARFAQPQRIEPDRVLGIVVPPLRVWDLLE